MILFIWHFDKVSPFFRGRKQISGYLIIGARGRFDLQRNREMFGGGETIPYPDCGCGYVCHNQQTFTLRGVDFTVLVIPTFFWVRKDFPENFCFSCDLKDEVGVTEVKGWEKAFQAEEGAGKSVAGAGSDRPVLWEERDSEVGRGDETGSVGRACRALGFHILFCQHPESRGEPVPFFCVGEVTWLWYGVWMGCAYRPWQIFREEMTASLGKWL